MGFTNSSLATYKKISPNKTRNRTHEIDTITIHCIVGQWTAKQGCDYFAKSSSKASCNYVVGKDGSIGLCVEEKDRSWCSSNASNDHRAITIEVASDTSHPYAVTDKAMEALIKLCADVCKRNGIKELKWKADKSLIGKVNLQNMTVHRWFKAKACPGEYLYSRHGYIANEVNKLLGSSVDTPSTTRTYLIKGDEGDEVGKLQENLNYLGYNCGTVDKSFGTKTDIALRVFQKDYKLTVDGKYGSTSKATLESAVAKKKASESTISNATTYKVVAGDTLSKIGSKTKVAWKTIADLNGIKAPYILKVGQVLKLPSGTSVSTSATSFKVKLKSTLNIRKTPNGELLKANGALKGLSYTIVEVDGNWGLLKSYQKNRNGWIFISDKYVTRL